jgi:hypothetical protein
MDLKIIYKLSRKELEDLVYEYTNNFGYCKDCKHGKRINEIGVSCNIFDMMTGGVFGCAFFWDKKRKQKKNIKTNIKR